MLLHPHTLPTASANRINQYFIVCKTKQTKSQVRTKSTFHTPIINLTNFLFSCRIIRRTGICINFRTKHCPSKKERNYWTHPLTRGMLSRSAALVFRRTQVFTVLLKVLDQAFQEFVVAYCLRIAHYAALPPCPCYSHIHPPMITQETNLKEANGYIVYK